MNGKNCQPFLDVQEDYVERPSSPAEVTYLLTFPVPNKDMLKNMGDNGITSKVFRIRQLEWKIWLKPSYDLSK